MGGLWRILAEFPGEEEIQEVLRKCDDVKKKGCGNVGGSESYRAMAIRIVE